jgi:FAD/FMN-containing dehydrogenase
MVQDIRSNESADGHSVEASSSTLPRRKFMSDAARVAALGAVAGWTPVFRIGPAEAQTCPTLPSFPSSITVYLQAYQNWSGEIQVSSVWTCVPTTPADVVTIANWAYAHGYEMRPRGMMHNWSPLTIAPTASCSTKVVLVDTTQYLTAVSINTASSPKSVTAQTGVTMESLLTQLEAAGLGVTATPAPGDLTLGGVLAIDGHGTAVPAVGETLTSGHTYGTISNLILSVTAVVWNASTNQYALQTYLRTDPHCQALLVHIGRSFIVSVKLQVGANKRLRCQSWFNVPATEMFAPAGSSGRTLASYIDSAGRVEAIWFPFTANPWLKVWSVASSKPLLSVQVNAPYNYSFSDNISSSISNLVAQLIGGAWSLTPTFGQTQYDIVAAGLVTTFTYDIWGWSKNLMLYVKPTTLRVTANGYAVLTTRANIQRAVNEFTTFYQARLSAYQAAGLFPINGPVEIRVTGLDNPADVVGGGAYSPQISALRPRPDHPEWNVAVWFDILTLPGTPTSDQFYREIEQWMFSNFSGSYATVRPEWSKGWGYTNTAAWSDTTVLGTTIPNAYRVGQAVGDNWDTAVASLDAFDPHRIFSSPLLDALAP